MDYVIVSGLSVGYLFMIGVVHTLLDKHTRAKSYCKALWSFFWPVSGSIGIGVAIAKGMYKIPGIFKTIRVNRTIKAVKAQEDKVRRA